MTPRRLNHDVATPEEILEAFSPEIRGIAGVLGRLVRETIPAATEHGYPGWRSIGYRHPRAGYFCGIFPFNAEGKLIFEHGHALPDPSGILEGATRQTRQVTIRQPSDIRREPLIDLILESVAYGEARKAAAPSARRAGAKA